MPLITLLLLFIINENILRLEGVKKFDNNGHHNLRGYRSCARRCHYI